MVLSPSDHWRMGRRIHHSWSELVSEFHESGVTQRAFALRHAISVGTLRRWIQRRSTEGQLSMLPVRVVAAPTPSTRAQRGKAATVLAISLPNGIQIGVPVGTDPRYVADMARRLS